MIRQDVEQRGLLDPLGLNQAVVRGERLNDQNKERGNQRKLQKPRDLLPGEAAAYADEVERERENGEVDDIRPDDGRNDTEQDEEHRDFRVHPVNPGIEFTVIDQHVLRPLPDRRKAIVEFLYGDYVVRHIRQRLRNLHHVRRFDIRGFERFGLRKHLSWRAVEQYLAAAHDHHAVAVAVNDFHVVRNDQNRLAALVHLFEQVHNPERLPPVLTGGRLVHDDDFRVHRDDCAHAEALALALAQVFRPGVFIVFQPDFGEHFANQRRALFTRFAEVVGAKVQFVEHAVRKDLLVRVLEYVTDGSGKFGDRFGLDVDAADADFAGLRFEKADDAAHQGGLSRAVLADDRRKIAFAERNRNVVKLLAVAKVAEDEVICLDNRFPLAGRLGNADLRRRFGGSGERFQLRNQRVRREGNAGNHAVFFEQAAQFNRLRHVHAEFREPLRLGKDFLRRAAEYDLSAVHNADAVGVLCDVVHLVFDEHDGDAVDFVDIFDDRKDVLLAPWVEHAGWLVKDDDLRQHGVHAADGYGLLLPAGKLLRLALAQHFDIQVLERLVDAAHALLIIVTEVFRPEYDVLLDGHAEELRVRVLKHKTHARRHFEHLMFARIHADDVDAAGHHALRKMRNDAVEALAKRALARARGAGDDEELALVDFQIDIRNRPAAAAFVDKVDVFNVDDGFCHTLTPPFSLSASTWRRLRSGE
ncbi:hypothetical protein SDC9_78075 [bioreactor metagenome]|uniref:Uncharacterized protein n=1 Tax=bioreactor metagenome TaxID=1076179 RepID=A0A644YSK1_9ZZZZ